MLLTTKTRYAVMAMVDLALSDTEVPQSLADIAERQELPLSYLEQLFPKLRKAELVKSIRGPGGGYLIARELEEITILSIVEAVDESLKMTRCDGDPKSGCMVKSSKCLTHALWRGLGKQISEYLASVTLGSLTQGSRKLSFIDELIEESC
jgi:Rrf2 family iron-sulfur cluster assembly transcriptional regulator